MAKCSYYLVVLILLAGFSCTNAQQSTDPVENFEHLWKTFDRHYGIFLPKRVDWDALYKVYRPKVTKETTNDELFDIMSSMLGHLNDNHVSLRGNGRYYCAGLLQQVKREGFSRSLVENKFIKGDFVSKMNGRFHYGKLSDKIGYFHFSGFGNQSQSAAVVDEIVEEFKNCDGIVIDVRMNNGGSDRVGEAIIGRFADKKRLYLQTQIRNGPEHDDFTDPKFFHAEPKGPRQFTKPVIVLTNRSSVSAADNFSMGKNIFTPAASMFGPPMPDILTFVFPSAGAFALMARTRAAPWMSPEGSPARIMI